MTTLEKIMAEIRKYLEDECINEKEAEGIMFCLDIIDKYTEQKPTKQREKELAEEWKCGYEMGFEEAKVFYEKEEPTSPCDLCRFDYMDGVCGDCPAMAKGGE